MSISHFIYYIHLFLIISIIIDDKNKYVTLEHESSFKQHGYICSNSQQYIVWVKIINFYFMPKIIRILRSCSMKIFCTFLTVNISKLHFWLVICIAKILIWTTLKMIFSIFRFFWPVIKVSFKNGPLWLVLCSRFTYYNKSKYKYNITII